jgi:hypothetical protein
MGVANLRAGAGQGDVHGLGRHELAHGGALELLHAAIEQGLGHAAHLVGALAEHRALPRLDLAHHAHEARDLALASHERHAGGLEFLGRLGALNHLASALFELLKLVDQTHRIPSPFKRRRVATTCCSIEKSVLGFVRSLALPRTDVSAVPPCLAAGCPPGEPSFARCRAGARLPYSACITWGRVQNCTLCPNAARRGGEPSSQDGRSGRSSGVNSGLVAAGGLSAGGPPSLRRRCGEARPLRQRSGQDDSTSSEVRQRVHHRRGSAAPGLNHDHHASKSESCRSQ